MKQAGLILLVVGFALTVFTSFSFFTKEKVLDIGEIKVTRDEPHSINWSPFAGVAVMAIGTVLLWRSGKK